MSDLGRTRRHAESLSMERLPVEKVMPYNRYVKMVSDP